MSEQPLVAAWREKRRLWLEHRKLCVECEQGRWKPQQEFCDDGKKLFNDVEAAARRAIEQGAG